MSGEDKRIFTRFPKSDRVILRLDGKELEANLVELSMVSATVHCSVNIPMKKNVRLRSGDLTKPILGQIVRAESLEAGLYRYGVLFRRITETEFNDLLRILGAS